MFPLASMYEMRITRPKYVRSGLSIDFKFTLFQLEEFAISFIAVLSAGASMAGRREAPLASSHLGAHEWRSRRIISRHFARQVSPSANSRVNY